MPQAPAHKLFFTMTPKEEKEIMESTIDEALKAIEEEIELAFPEDMIPSMAPLPGAQRYQRYVQLTPPIDTPLILDGDYLKKYEIGQVRPPFSMFWQQMLAFPDIFKEAQRDFLKLAKEYGFVDGFMGA